MTHPHESGDCWPPTCIACQDEDAVAEFAAAEEEARGVR